MTNSDMSNADREQLHRAYAQTPRDEPAAALDAAILAAARDAVAAGAVRRGRSWAPAMAVAAMLVVAVSLSLLMKGERAAIEVALAPPAQGVATADQAKSRAETANVQIAMAPPQRQPAAQSAEMPAARRQAAETNLSPAAPRPELESAGRIEDKTESEARRADAASAMPQPPTAGAASAGRSAAGDEAVATLPERAAPAQSDVPASALISPPARSASAHARPAAGAAAGAGGLRLATPSADAHSGETAAADVAKKSEPPEAWLARIEKLRKQGRMKEAEDSLVEFRKRYPNYKIPAASAAPR